MLPQIKGTSLRLKVNSTEVFLKLQIWFIIIIVIIIIVIIIIKAFIHLFIQSILKR